MATEGECREVTEQYRLVSDSQWRYLHSKINDVSKQLTDLRWSLKDMSRPKKFLQFSEVVPPESVCRDINSMMRGNTSYDGFLGRLAEHYGVPLMSLWVDETIPDGTLAVYRKTAFRPDGNAYTKSKTVGRETVLHEFFHHLVHHKVVVVKKKREEEYADRFARLFLNRAGWSR